MRSLSRHGSSWDIYTACLYCAASDETGEGTETRVVSVNSSDCSKNDKPFHVARPKASHQALTWRLDSWVKAFSHPG